MKLVLYFSLVSFCINCTMAAVLDNPSHFMALIKRLRQYYSTSAVIFGIPTVKGNSIDELEIMFYSNFWGRLLQREYVYTINTKIEKLPEVAKSYNSVVRPLTLVFIVDSRGTEVFSNITKSIEMSFSVWFVIFMQMTHNQKSHYCYHPPGNLFSLLFNSQMLVMCGDDLILREWYSVDGNSTEIYELGEWHPDGYLQKPPRDLFAMNTNRGLYERRHDLKGLILRGVSVQTSSLFIVKNKKLHGYIGNVISELEAALNFSLKITREANEYGTINMTTKRWSGAVGEVVAGKVDIGVADFSMTSVRLDYVDYTIPLITTRNCLYLKQPDTYAVKWFAYYRTFHISVWFCILLIIVIAQCVLAFIRFSYGSHNFAYTMYEELNRVWGIFCQQGLIEFPPNSSLRVAYFSLLLTGVTTLAFYSGSLISFLTANIRDAPFRTLDAFIKDGTYRVIVIKGSADYDMFVHSTDPVSVAITKLLRPVDELPLDVEHGFRMLCEDSKLAFFNTELHRKLVDLRIPCKVLCLNFGRIESISLMLSKDNQYTSVLNYHLQKLLNAGVLGRFKITRREENLEYERKFQPVGLGSVVSLLIIFALGIAVALVVLFVETHYHRHTRVEDFHRTSD